ncbi:MAG: selenide, water dikinase SelD [SAR324 cluster bacterium]|nr:selenide, water dikinase SelD [SAR324 cluster bacterium]
MDHLLATLPAVKDANVLVGIETSDDAGVYRLNDEQAMVMTVDFITPPVDDPFLFGQIAAANSLSDVYAMGGKPLACMNLVGFPSDKLGMDILDGIIAGALHKITEAGAVLVGGHTVEDEEPKFGLSVTGMVHPEKIWRNVGAQPGDQLILTKPLGSGVLFNANLKQWVSQEALQECLEHLVVLNKTAAEVASGFEIHAATDITGFGLAGHCLNMARGSGVTLKITVADLPVMREALEMYVKGMSTGANLANRRKVEKYTRYEKTLTRFQQELTLDPQTSGGLLFSVAGTQAESLLTALHLAGVTSAKIIGSVLPSMENIALHFA